LILNSTDCLITLIYFAVLLSIGYSVRSRIKTGNDFFQAGRSLPAWLCGLAFLAAGMGAPEVFGLGAAGARYGFAGAEFFLIGAIPAMLFAGNFMLPYYYGSKARSVPEFLALRFDGKTRTLNAGLFAAMTILSGAAAMFLMAAIFRGLHIFDALFHALGWPVQGMFAFSVVIPAVVVLTYVALGGLRSVIYNQAAQFLVMIAGLLPVVLLGLKKIGGWSGLEASLPAAYFHRLTGTSHGNDIKTLSLGLGLGAVLGASYWCSDFRVLQFAMAAKNMDSARRTPLYAAIGAIILSLLLIVPGTVAIGLPTPRTSTVTRYENGAIIHEITVARPEAEAGNGLVPARIDPATGKPMLDSSGGAVLNYEMAIPNLLLKVLPNGLLGLGLTALLASLMSGIAAGASAFNTVFTHDLYGSYFRKGASDEPYLKVGRWATAGAVLSSLALACIAHNFGSPLLVLLLVFSVVTVPLFAIILLGMFWKRATGHGAFAGLIGGAVATLLHHGLTLPIDVLPGAHGGWIAVLYRYPGDMAQCFWTAGLAFIAALIVAVAVSLCTRPRPRSERMGLVLSRKKGPWWKRPEALALAILLLGIGVAFFVS
jgi:SSS family solute:Na+ symporter